MSSVPGVFTRDVTYIYVCVPSSLPSHDVSLLHHFLAGCAAWLRTWGLPVWVAAFLASAAVQA